MTATISVLVVDDQELIRSGFSLILSQEPDIDVVGEASNGVEAVALTESLRPDVVLMDIRMPEMDGITATRLVSDMERSKTGAPRVLILTTFDLDEHVYDAVRAGASGFLLKDAVPEELVRAVRVVAAGDATLAPSVTRQLLEEFGRSTHASTPNPGVSQLTFRETEVLMHIAKGLSNTEIAGELYVSDATVKTHVSHILTKLDVRDRVQAVVVAYESGVVTPGAAFET